MRKQTKKKQNFDSAYLTGLDYKILSDLVYSNQHLFCSAPAFQVYSTLLAKTLRWKKLFVYLTASSFRAGQAGLPLAPMLGSERSFQRGRKQLKVDNVIIWKSDPIQAKADLYGFNVLGMLDIWINLLGECETRKELSRLRPLVKSSYEYFKIDVNPTSIKLSLDATDKLREMPPPRGAELTPRESKGHILLEYLRDACEMEERQFGNRNPSKKDLAIAGMYLDEFNSGVTPFGVDLMDFLQHLARHWPELREAKLKTKGAFDFRPSSSVDFILYCKHKFVIEPWLVDHWHDLPEAESEYV